MFYKKWREIDGYAERKVEKERKMAICEAKGKARESKPNIDEFSQSTKTEHVSSISPLI